MAQIQLTSLSFIASSQNIYSYAGDIARESWKIASKISRVYS